MAKKPRGREAKTHEVKVEAKKSNFIYILIYFFTWLSGLIAYLIEKKDKNIRFHAMQSILLGIVIFVLTWFLFFLIITPLIGFVLWLYGLYVGYKASTGETIRIPYLAEYADKYV